jgi:hypothetical protein
MDINTSCRPTPLPAGMNPDGGCTPVTTVTNVCVEVVGGFCPVAAKRTIVISALCEETRTYADLTNINITSTVTGEVKCPTPVFVCGPGASGGSSGSGPMLDREFVTACNAAGQQVAVQYDVTVSPPVELSRWNLFTNAAEPAGALVKCPTAYAASTSAFTRTDVVTSGTVAAGQASVTFTNTGTTNATVQGATLLPGKETTITAYADPATSRFVRTPEITYVASATASLTISVQS